MGDTKEIMTIKKNVTNMILDTRKGRNYSKMFYLKAKIYDPEGLKNKDTNINLTEEKKV